MIIIINSKTKPEKVSDLVNWIERKGLKTHITEGDYQNIIGVIGDTSRIDEDQVKSFDIVEAVSASRSRLSRQTASSTRTTRWSR